MSARELITDHLDLWTGAVTSRSTAGRGRNGKIELTGIKKLRELILELAVRGKLVDQDPDDEPASVLLERIAEEKARLVKEGKIKKPKKLPEISEEEKPFELPEGWVWSRMHYALIKITDGTHHSPPNHETGSFMYVSAKNIKPEGVLTSGITYVTEEVHEEIYSRCDPEPGDLLYIKDGATTGIAAINNLPIPFSMLSSVALLKPHHQSLSNKFLLYCLRSPFFYEEMRSGMTGVAITRVTLKKLDCALIPIPPAAVQHRIVEKVDELMALCDRLEQQVGDQLEAHEVLVDTLLNALTRSADATEVAESWARIAEHFDTLFTTEPSIDKLKQTIFQLAVMGRLVPQNPDDEPVSCLLQRYGIKSKPYVIHGWAEVALGGLGKIIGGSTPTKSKTEFWDGDIPWVSPKDMKLPLIHDSQVRITEQALKKTSLKVVPENSLLMVVRGMILAHSFPVAITGREVTINQDMKALVAPNEISKYLLLYLQAAKSKLVELVDRSSHGTCKLISEKLWSHITYLPPIEEQARIIDKVDELMALCDQLKARLGEAGETRTHLAEAVVEQAVS